MITNELLTFIKDQLAQGATKDEIKKMLVTDGGWEDSDVNEGFQATGMYVETYQNALAKVAQGVDQSGAEGESHVAPIILAASPVSEMVNPASVAPIESPLVMNRVAEPAGAPKMSGLSMRESLASPQFASSMASAQKFSTVKARPEIHFSSLPPLTKSAPAEPVESLANKPSVSVAPATLQTKQSPVISNQAFSTQSISPVHVASPVSSVSLASPSISQPFVSPVPSVAPLAAPHTQNPFLNNFINNPSISTRMEARVPAQGKIIIKKKRRIFRKFLLTLFVLFILGGGFVFAYLSGFVPVKIPQLETLADRVSVMLGITSLPISPAAPSGDAQNQAGEEQAKIAPPPVPVSAYFSDRIRILLPSGTVTSVTATASAIASELRGRVATCSYTDTNECTLVVPVKKDGDLDTILADLDTDKRIKGAEKVPLTVK